MASLSSEMIVDVEQYQAFAEAVKTESAKWESTWDAYLKQLNFVQDSGIEAGAAAKAFLEFADTVSKLNGAFEKFGEDVAQDITSFLKDVDEADSTLFKNEGNKVFTDEEFKKAYSVVDNTPQSFRIEDDTWIVILIEKLCKLFWKGYGQKVKIEDYESELVKRVQEVKMKTSEDLAQVKAGVRAADHTFQQYLAARQNELTELLALLKMIASILETPSGMISHGDLTAITCALSDLKKADVTVTDENVVSFSKNISNYFGPTTAGIRTYCESSVASLITTDFDNYRATVKAAKSYFDSYSQDYNETQKNIDKYKNMFDQILSLYQKYGAEKWAEHSELAKNASPKERERFKKIEDSIQSMSLLDVAPGEIYDYEDERYFLIDYIMDGDVTLE